MDNSLTVRLFVRTQTYDISCDPRQPAKWLLMQAKNIQRSSQKQTSQEEELEVLYNRTTRRVINLEDSIGSSISSMDVVDARTLLQTPDTSCNSAMFPWLRSYAGGLLSSDKIDSSNGLFFQQLYAFTLIGKRTPVSASQRKQKEDQDNFLSLLHTYVMGSYDRDYIPQPQPTGTRRLTAPSSPMYRPHYDPNGFSDSGSDSSVEESPSYPTYFSANDYTKPQRTLISPSPVKRMIVDAVPESAPEWKLIQNSQYGIINRDGGKYIEPTGLIPCELECEAEDPYLLMYCFPVSPNCYDILQDEGSDSTLPPDVDLEAGEQDGDNDGMITPVSGFTASSGLLPYEEEARALKSARTLALKVKEVSI
ncbi:uncharacterized protein PHALS_09828 [Plasmopara halstedii]|uniref:Uncharacterized protein n=1 Tax=Plasmopara halstedii TaxID=4781 RepID=A0A0P1AEW1_PLAHL|nr:uncharacterized protein PHALS_09828 [Plasmopara halstedii]CEG39588.1 hypothetical protein PHALS_09828 [Plasmopara halstedii]|eukprot:XP_024575957.1 hypothetical protein PHALS_09828 [Plasmopara halstedii]